MRSLAARETEGKPTLRASEGSRSARSRAYPQIPIYQSDPPPRRSPRNQARGRRRHHLLQQVGLLCTTLAICARGRTCVWTGNGREKTLTNRTPCVTPSSPRRQRGPIASSPRSSQTTTGLVTLTVRLLIPNHHSISGKPSYTEPPTLDGLGDLPPARGGAAVKRAERTAHVRFRRWV